MDQGQEGHQGVEGAQEGAHAGVEGAEEEDYPNRDPNLSYEVRLLQEVVGTHRHSFLRLF